jgi:transposase
MQLSAEKLSEERSWTAAQLAAAVNEKFKLKVNRESMRAAVPNLIIPSLSSRSSSLEV